MSEDSPEQVARFHTIAVVGVGLLGGSVAMAARARGLAERVIGIGRNPSRLEAARAAGVIDAFDTRLVLASVADLVVVCTPVDRIARDVLDVLEQLGPDGAVTDVGSAKGSIVRAVSDNPLARAYVPAHPLAGSEQTGWEAGSASLFDQKLCVLTPWSGIDPDRLDRVDRFWRSCGMQTMRVSPEEHDRLLALTSHLPHVVAAALASLVGAIEQPFAASGFRDTTRIAAGDAAVWTPILLANADRLLEALDRFDAAVGELRKALSTGNTKAVTRWLTAARTRREALN